jgi:hypothetical protein
MKKRIQREEDVQQEDLQVKKGMGINKASINKNKS